MGGGQGDRVQRAGYKLRVVLDLGASWGRPRSTVMESCSRCTHVRVTRLDHAIDLCNCMQQNEAVGFHGGGSRVWNRECGRGRSLNLSQKQRAPPVLVWCWISSMSTSAPSQGSSVSQHLRAAKGILRHATFGAEYVRINEIRLVW